LTAIVPELEEVRVFTVTFLKRAVLLALSEGNLIGSKSKGFA